MGSAVSAWTSKTVGLSHVEVGRGRDLGFFGGRCCDTRFVEPTAKGFFEYRSAIALEYPV